MAGPPDASAPAFAAPAQAQSYPQQPQPIAATPLASPRPLGRRELRQRQKLHNHESWRARARTFRASVMTLASVDSDMKVASVEVLGQEVQDGVTYYRLRIHSVDAAMGEWELLRRYSDFDQLRKSLGVRDKRVGSIFPGKTGFVRADVAEAEKRKPLLQAWLNGLITEFASGGDGRNAIVPVYRQSKLGQFHSFFGLDSENRISDPSARMVPNAALLAATPLLPEASAPPLEAMEQEAAPDEEAQLQAAVAASVAEAEAASTEEEARLAADVAAIASLQESEKQEKLRLEEIAKQTAADELLARQFEQEAEEVRRKTEEEEVRRKTDEEAQRRAVKDAFEAGRKAEGEEQARRQAEEEKEAKRKAEEEEALRNAAEEEAQQKAAEEEALRKAAEEEAQQKAAEEEALRKGAEEQALRKAEEDEAQRKADEEKARLRVEEDEAQRKADEEKARLRVEEEARLKAEEEARLEAEQEEIQRKVEEEKAHQKAEAEEARRKAEEAEAAKSWLQKAMDLAGQARQIEDQGEPQQALDQYKKCVALFAIVYKREKSEKIRDAVGLKMQELTCRADALSEAIAAAEAARVAGILSESAPSRHAIDTTLDAEAAQAAKILAGASDAGQPAAVPLPGASGSPALDACSALPEA